jgi:signal transduction histidine kinase
MKRPWQIAVVLGACFAVVLAAMAWTSFHVLSLDRMEARIAADADHESNIRTSLYQMELMVAPLVAQEASRPYFEYTAFYPAERAYTRMFGQLANGDVLLPSPMLAQTAPYVLLNFQIGPDGAATSPQAPTDQMRRLAVRGYVTPEAIDAASQRLVQLEAQPGWKTLAAVLPKPDDPAVPLAVAVLRNNDKTVPDNNDQQFINQKTRNLNDPQQAQAIMNTRAQQEQDARYRATVGNTLNNWNGANGQFNASVNQMAGSLASDMNDVREGVVRAVWVGDALVLARRINVGGQEYVQGAWLDWDALRQTLLAEVTPLLPQAKLVPVKADDLAEARVHGAIRATGGGADGGVAAIRFATGDSSWSNPPAAAEPVRLLAALPVRLDPGLPPELPPSGLSLRMVSLVVAWIGVLVAGLAVSLVLRQAVVLSERRAAFVSAVTHELRTPLTTFRMYSEMLSGGMVTDESKRQRYLNTLRIEANRLTHLVENVLSYARLERGRARGRIEEVGLDDLLVRVRDRLTERAAQAGMELVTETLNGSGAARVRADVSAVEQILFNLIDNACKYAATASDKRLHLVADLTGDRAVLSVCDHGPGISDYDGRRLFRPFTKSARDAANSAPGVGLGLALSRRLAREMGGDLTLEPPAGRPDGACFVLSLPTP